MGDVSAKGFTVLFNMGNLRLTKLVLPLLLGICVEVSTGQRTDNGMMENCRCYPTCQAMSTGYHRRGPKLTRPQIYSVMSTRPDIRRKVEFFEREKPYLTTRQPGNSCGCGSNCTTTTETQTMCGDCLIAWPRNGVQSVTCGERDRRCTFSGCQCSLVSMTRRCQERGSVYRLVLLYCPPWTFGGTRGKFIPKIIRVCTSCCCMSQAGMEDMYG